MRIVLRGLRAMRGDRIDGARFSSMVGLGLEDDHRAGELHHRLDLGIGLGRDAPGRAAPAWPGRRSSARSLAARGDVARSSLSSVIAPMAVRILSRRPLLTLIFSMSALGRGAEVGAVHRIGQREIAAGLVGDARPSGRPRGYRGRHRRAPRGCGGTRSSPVAARASIGAARVP